MPTPRCGARTKNTDGCRFPANACPLHGDQANPPRSPAPDRAAAPVSTGAPPALANQDERAFAWWTIGELLAERLSTPQGSVIASLLRIIHAFGPPEMSEEEALAEAEFRGRIAHGLPPRGDAEWAKAERIFEPAAIEEFRRWERLLERHRGNVDQP
jgi:hypothetical protein